MVGGAISWITARAEGGHWEARMVLALARRFAVLEFFDRSLAIAAQMLVAFIPLVIALTSLIADDSVVAEEMIRRLGLTGASVELVQVLFDDDLVPEQSSGLGTLSLFFLLISLYLFGKRVRHLYERAFDLPAKSAKQEWRNLWWVLMLAMYTLLSGALRSVWYDHGGGIGALMFALTVVMLFGFMWWTPRFLLARRLTWKHALPSAAIATVGLLGVAVWSTIWLPEVIINQAERYGAIGITFGIFTWLYALSLALVAGAVVAGAVEDVRQDRKPAVREFPV
jgi:uncharacterized BrkB/YihY/UPF0761 family membrane protein